ncbi:MAG: 30S ribosomal protein S9 [Elusimicrobia bacterium]|nr:30S ribosomal protein S9 [Elusimicrobiota bacterium]
METKQSRTGRRKTSVAQVKLTEGKGNVVINSKPMEDYFRGCSRYQTAMLAPLAITDNLKKFDLLIKVNGGGPSSQAGAIRHGIARSLSTISDDFKKSMKKAGFLTRDSRMVERKKPGQPKARKRFQFSKR